MITARSMDPDRLVDIVRRLSMLEAIRRDTLRREELQRRLEISKNTYYRHLNRLSEGRLIEESDDGIALTPAGEVVVEEVDRFEGVVLTALGESEGDRELLLEVVRHARGLDALADGPRDRRELEGDLDVSKTTGYRLTRSLEERGLIEKSGGRYALTPAGEEIRDAAVTLEATVGTAIHLGPVLEAVRDVTPPLDLDALADATVTKSTFVTTHSPVTRFIALVEETDALRGVEMNFIAPLYIRDIRQRVVDGMKTEVLAKPVTAATHLAELPLEIVEACQEGNWRHYLYDDPPCGIAIFDDRVMISVRGGASGTAMCVDTDSPRVREWAEAVFESCKAEAVPMEEYSPWGLRRAMERGSFDAAEPIDG